MKALEIKNLTKVYDNGYKALDQVNFDIQEGEIFALLGPNGSGKTTLISILSSLIEATAGSAKIFSKEVGPKNYETKYLLGLVPQETVSHGFFTIQEILEFVSGYYGIANNKKRIDYLLVNLGLMEHKNKRVAQLSGGMKRRLLIAKALVHKPKLLLLDEPTAGVDIELRNSLWKFVKELNKEGCTVLLTTHYLQEAEELCNRLAIIDRGVMKRLGATSHILKDFTQRLMEIKLAKPVAPLVSPYLKEQTPVKLCFEVPNDMKFGELISQVQLPVEIIEDFKIKEGSLEDAFLKVLGTKT